MNSEAAEVTTAVGQLSLPQQWVSASVISFLSWMAVILKSMRYEIYLTSGPSPRCSFKCRPPPKKTQNAKNQPKNLPSQLSQILYKRRGRRKMTDVPKDSRRKLKKENIGYYGHREIVSFLKEAY